MLLEQLTARHASVRRERARASERVFAQIVFVRSAASRYASAFSVLVSFWEIVRIAGLLFLERF